MFNNSDLYAMIIRLIFFNNAGLLCPNRGKNGACCGFEGMQLNHSTSRAFSRAHCVTH